MRNVYLEPEGGNVKSRNILIGGAVAGVIAILCALALANTFKRSEKRK